MPIAYKVVVVLVSLASLGLAFFGGMLAYRFACRPAGHLHSVVRRQAILSQAEQVPAGGVVILGDSIVEFLFLDRICGQTVLNAGIGSGTIKEVLTLCEAVLERARPASVIISVGVNDAQLSRQRDIEAWLGHYDKLLRALSAYRVFVMAINPVEAGKPLGDNYFDQSFINRQNLGLIALSKKHGANYIPPTAAATGLTSDGVHPNELGNRALKTRIETAFGCGSS